MLCVPYSLLWELPSATITLHFARNEAFRYQCQLTTFLSIPHNSNMVPLTIVNGGIFSETEKNILQVREQGDLYPIALGLYHNVAVTCHVRRSVTWIVTQSLILYVSNAECPLSRVPEHNSFVAHKACVCR